MTGSTRSFSSRSLRSSPSSCFGLGQRRILDGERQSVRLDRSACRTASDGARPRRPQATRPTGGDLIHTDGFTNA
jgi:hypothetical protein